MKQIAIAGLFLTILLLFSSVVQARQGCCSWHGGVCGCGCCDATPLSSTCLPYYPECTGGAYSLPTLAPSCPLFSSYDSLSGTCKCYSGYVSTGDQCISNDQYCWNNYGYNSRYNILKDACECRYGYVWNSSGTKCISGDQACWDKYGYNSTYDSLNNSCECMTGYRFEGDQCVLDTSTYSPSFLVVPTIKPTIPIIPTSTPRPTVTPTSTPTLTPTPIPTNTPSPTPKTGVLGETTTKPTSPLDTLIGLGILGGLGYGGYRLVKKFKKSAQ